MPRTNAEGIRRLVVILSLGLFGLGLSACATGGQATVRTAPVERTPAQDIPSDLDVVLRVDLDRVRAALPQPLFERLEELLLAALQAAAFAEDMRSAHVLYLGIRPFPQDRASDPPGADYVLVLDGLDRAGDSERFWEEQFFPPRDLGASIFRYQAKDASERARPGRVYEKVGRRLVIVSAAEIDAVERVIEAGAPATALVPDGRGALSVRARTDRIMDWVGRASAPTARLLERCSALSAHVDLDRQSLDGTLRVSFVQVSDAERIEAAARLLYDALDDNSAGALDVEFERFDRDLVVRAHVPMDFLFDLLGLFAAAGPV